LVAAGVAQILSYYSSLPDPVASHFNLNGQPNGWSSRVSFFGIYLGSLVIVAGLFWIVPVLLQRSPDHRISLPRRDYWLAPERRRETLSLISRRVLWFGFAIIAFMLCTIQLVIQANLPQGGRLHMPAMWVLLGSVLTFAVVWCAGLLRGFLTGGRDAG
jgi:uncharacterized membrane protein